MERRDRRPLPESERGGTEHRGERLVDVDEVEALARERPTELRHRMRAEDEVRERSVAGHDHRAPERDHAGRRRPGPPRPRVEDAAEGAGRVVPDQQTGLDPERLERARLRLGVVDDAAAERPGVRNDDADLHRGRGYRRRASSRPRIVPARRSCASAEIPAPWEPPPRWKSFSPPGRSQGTTCSRSGIAAAAPPSTAGSSGPRAAASSPSPRRPVPISKLRSGMSSCGTRSPARWSPGPSRSASGRERTTAPIAAPVATCSETITQAIFALVWPHAPAPGAPPRGLAADEGHAPSLLPDRRQGAAGDDRAAQPVVERAALRRRPGP